MLNCVVLDDEPLASEILGNYLADIPDLTLAGSFDNVFEAFTFLETSTVDVLFLDIEIPEVNGIDFLKSLSHPPITVFTTAFRDYAFEGFELGVIDFLLKPISKARFTASVEKIREFISLKALEADLETPHEKAEFIFVKSGVDRIKLFLARVIYIQGLKDYAIIHTETGKLVTKGSVKYMQELFHEPDFIRVHKSFIVAKRRIQQLTRNRIVIGENLIPIGRAYKENMQKVIYSG